MTASYLDHFAFTDAPFPAHPDGDRHVVVPGTEDLPERILAAFDSGHALVTLTGPEGTGTTMTARAAAARAPAGTPVALVTAPAPESGQSLLSVVCHGFGLPQRETWAEMTGTLGAFLEDTVARGEHPLLIIDDAQALEVTGLEGVKLLTTLETGDGALLSILLAGRPALHDLLGRSALRPLAQRITLKLETAPLTPEQGHAYIDARLAHVRPDGVDFDPIAPAAKDRIVRAAGGLPPAIDHLCDAALAAAAEDGALVVEDSHVDLAEAALIDRGADATVITAGKPGSL